MKTRTQSHAPADKVSSCVNLATMEAIQERNQFSKGRCLFCGEIFNLRVATLGNDLDWRDPDLCPECGEIFGNKKAGD